MQKQANPLPPSKGTIDEKHTEFLNYFHTVETEQIPELLSQKQTLKLELKKLHKTQIDHYMEIKDQIQTLSQKIKSLKSLKKQYLLDNSKHIFDYFEEKKKVSSGNNGQNVNVLNSFFKIKAKTDNASTLAGTKYTQSKNTYHAYWKNINHSILNIQDFVVSSDICECCKIGELIPQDEEGILICNNTDCGQFVTYIVDSSKPSNKEPPNEVSYTAYIRLNHFKEILSQFQAKETTQIPESVIEDIKRRIKKERIKDYAKELNYDKMREILRKLGYNKYFEHIQYINSIFGIRPPIMSDELHETLCVLFIEIQKPWALHCPPDRTNFFNYTYTLYQLCVLLDQTQYLPYIPLLRDLIKQRQMDLIWKEVCAELGWQYFPTV
jgi:hypothetical protein